MRILSFITQKGGTGKSTLAFNVAVAAAEAGETVAMFDLDKQGMVSVWSSYREDRQDEAEKAGDAAKVKALAVPHVEHYPQDRLAELPQQVRALKGFSLVILDTKGEDSPAQRIAIQAATFNIVVMRPSRADADMTMPTVTALMNGNRPFAFALTQAPAIPNNPRGAEMAAKLKGIGKLLEPVIFNRLEYQDSYASGLGVTEQNTKGKAAEEIRALWKSIDKMTKAGK